MKIWKRDFTLEQATQISKNTLVEHLGIEYLEIGDNFLSARMPIDSRTCQPYRIMHGGASCVLAETLGSLAGNFCIENNQQCVGVEINTSHVRAAKNGWVIGTAKPLHLGKSTQVWEVPIVNEKGELISMTRFRNSVLEKHF